MGQPKCSDAPCGRQGGGHPAHTYSGTHPAGTHLGEHPAGMRPAGTHPAHGHPAGALHCATAANSQRPPCTQARWPTASYKERAGGATARAPAPAAGLPAPAREDRPALLPRARHVVKCNNAAARLTRPVATAQALRQWSRAWSRK